MDAAEPDAHIEVEDDPEAHLSTFTEKQKAWAAKHSLDLLGDAGMMLAANLKWPEQHRLQVATEGGFLRAYTAFGILNKAGLYVGDLSNGKTQAIAVFTDQYQLQLKEAGMHQSCSALSMAWGFCATLRGAAGSVSRWPALRTGRASV